MSPSVCVISSKCVFASEILSSKTLPEPIKREESVAWYPWTINNKYYTADVRLCVVPSTFQMSSEIAQSMQAFIAYFDSTAVRDLSVRYSLKISTVYLSCDTCVTCIVFAEGWSGKATSLDISGGRSCSGGAHSGVRQSL